MFEFVDELVEEEKERDRVVWTGDIEECSFPILNIEFKYGGFLSSMTITTFE